MTSSGLWRAAGSGKCAVSGSSSSEPWVSTLMGDIPMGPTRKDRIVTLNRPHQGDQSRPMQSHPPQGPKSVAIIIRVMDRADELRVSLPSLLNQDYPSYRVVVVDHSSQDGLRAVLEDAKRPRLRVVRCPRPAFFNPSSSGNTGVRYSFSDLLFFLDTGMRFRDEHHLSEIVQAFE